MGIKKWKASLAIHAQRWLTNFWSQTNGQQLTLVTLKIYSLQKSAV